MVGVVPIEGKDKIRNLGMSVLDRRLGLDLLRKR